MGHVRLVSLHSEREVVCHPSRNPIARYKYIQQSQKSLLQWLGDQKKTQNPSINDSKKDIDYKKGIPMLTLSQQEKKEIQ